MRYKRNSERKDDINPLRSELSLSKLSEMDEDDFMNIVDDKLENTAKMTTQIRSTLKSLENSISNRRRVISEIDNSSEEG